MTNEVLLKINNNSQDSKLLVAYLMTLPYVEMLSESESEDFPEEFKIPVFSPKNNDDLKEHISKIEKSIISNGLVDNEDVLTKTQNILTQYESKMVG